LKGLFLGTPARVKGKTPTLASARLFLPFVPSRRQTLYGRREDLARRIFGDTAGPLGGLCSLVPDLLVFLHYFFLDDL